VWKKVVQFLVNFLTVFSETVYFFDFDVYLFLIRTCNEKIKTHLLISFYRTMALGSTQSLAEMSTRSISWG